MLFNKILNKDITGIHVGKTVFSYTDIQQHIQSFSDYPILKDSAFKQGVYKNYNEFKSNNPSIINYELHPGKLSDEVFINENNQSYLLQDFLGLCNGKNLFIRSANNLFQLIRSNNTYNVRGAKSLTIPTNEITNALLNATSRSAGLPNAKQSYNPNFKIRLTALQLNICRMVNYIRSY